MFLDRLIQENRTPKLAILIHFFGVRRDADRFLSICRKYGILVLEDLAHMLISPESGLGVNSDYVLYSLRKIIGVPDGAILQTNTLDTPSLIKPPVSIDPRRMVYILMNKGELIFNTISRRFGSARFWKYFWKIFGLFFSSYRFLMWYYQHPTRMSCLSEALLKRFPWRTVINRRLYYEQLYSTELDRTVFTHLNNPEEGHCAMGYAVLVEKRDSLVQELSQNGIYGLWFEYKWDHFPADEIHNEARNVMKKHFLFPTAYSLSVYEIKKVILIANNWVKNNKS